MCIVLHSRATKWYASTHPNSKLFGNKNRLASFRRKSFEISPDLVAYTTKRLKSSPLIPLDGSRVFKAAVNQARRVGKNGTTLPSVVTDGEHIIQRLIVELTYAFGSMVRNVYPEFFHDRNRFGTNVSRFSPGAFHFEAISGVMCEKPLSHLASRRVASTQN